MYAIVRDRSKQYKVEPKMELDIDLCDAEKGSVITLDDVLYVNTGSEIKVGAPVVKGAKVVCEVVGEAKDVKLVVFKFRRRKHSKKRTGHRQKYTRVRVTDITA